MQSDALPLTPSSTTKLLSSLKQSLGGSCGAELLPALCHIALQVLSTNSLTTASRRKGLWFWFQLGAVMMYPWWQKNLGFASVEKGLWHRQSLAGQDPDRSPYQLAVTRTGNTVKAISS